MNTTTRILIATSAATAIFLGTLGTSCESSTGENEDVVYEAETNDEALQAVLARVPVDDAANAATLTFPTAGATVPASAPPTFTWKVGAMTARHRHVPSQLLAPPQELVPVRATSRVAELLLGGVRSAYAHGEPVSGDTYFLVISSTTDAKLLRVFTTKTDYTPDAAAFDKLKAAGGTLTAVVTRAILEENRVAMDGGPFRGVETTFTVQ